jgi:hypothetical protein
MHVGFARPRSSPVLTRSTLLTGAAGRLRAENSEDCENGENGQDCENNEGTVPRRHPQPLQRP